MGLGENIETINRVVTGCTDKHIIGRGKARKDEDFMVNVELPAVGSSSHHICSRRWCTFGDSR